MAINYTYPVKGSPITTDEFLIIDSVDNSTKKVTVANILALGQGSDVGVASFVSASPLINGGTATDVNLTLDTVPVAKGGTALTALGSALNVLQVNAAGTALEYASVVEAAQHVIQDVRYLESVVKGDPVYIDGYNLGQGITQVGRADASDPTKMPAYGVANEDASQNTNGTITAIGSFNGTFDTSFLDEGEVIYVNTAANDVAGRPRLTSTKPSGEANLIQNIGFCSRENANNGEIEVVAVGRTNATPNLNSAKIFLGNSSNQSVATAVTGEVSLTNAGVTAINSIAGNIRIQGYRPIVQVTASGSIAPQDAGKTLVSTNNSGGTIAIDLEDSSDYAIGTEIQVIQKGSSAVEVTASGSTEINGASLIQIAAQYGEITLKKYSTNDWMAFGDVQ